MLFAGVHEAASILILYCNRTTYQIAGNCLGSQVDSVGKGGAEVGDCSTATFVRFSHHVEPVTLAQCHLLWHSTGGIRSGAARSLAL